MVVGQVIGLLYVKLNASVNVKMRTVIIAYGIDVWGGLSFTNGMYVFFDGIYVAGDHF